MKVLASLADSASLQELEFSRTVDTSNPSSEVPKITEVVPGPLTGVKKQAAITHFLRINHDTTVIARKNGVVIREDKTIAEMESDIVGLALLNDYVVVFSARGYCVAVGASKTLTFEIRSGLTCVVQDKKNLARFASAGEEPLADVFELNFKKSSVEVVNLWNATQPPNDMLDLPELNKVSALTFAGDKLVAVTSHGRLRVYDVVDDKTGQPEHMIQITKDALKCVESDSEHPGTVIIGDSRSTVGRWSLNPPKLLGHYKGVNGSTRCISMKGPFVALGGLDRYIRVFNVVTRQPAGKVYVGKEIWAILLFRNDLDDEKEDLDDFWRGIKKRRVGPPGRKSGEEETQEESEEEEEENSEIDSEEDNSDASSASSFEGFADE